MATGIIQTKISLKCYGKTKLERKFLLKMYKSIIINNDNWKFLITKHSVVLTDPNEKKSVITLDRFNRVNPSGPPSKIEITNFIKKIYEARDELK